MPDRYGETEPTGEHPPCPNNGRSEDDQGRPVFCPLCRPNLSRAELDKQLWGFGGPPHPRTEETP